MRTRKKNLQQLAVSASRTRSADEDTIKMSNDLFADLERTLDQVAESNPRISQDSSIESSSDSDLRAILEATLAVNSSLVLDDLLQVVMHKAIELMHAERGLIMLLNEEDELQVRSAYNLCKEQMMEEDFNVSSSITSKVAQTGKSIYTSDAMADDRYAQQQSVLELHLRSIMCVPLSVKGHSIGVIYLDNSTESKMFLKSDLYVFELFAQLVSNALNNAGMYESLLRLERYNESIVSTSPVGIVVLDSHGCFSTINSAALEIFDFDKKNISLVGESEDPTDFLATLPEKQRSPWKNMITKVLNTGEEYFDHRYCHNTGYLEKVLSIKLCPISGLPDSSSGLIMAVEDITEKMTMEQYVILTEKLVARGEMAASVAHELNNYLSIISNNAELLSLNIDRGKLDKIQFNAKSITDSIQKIKRFVDSLMDFSQPEPEYILYDLRSLIDDVLFSLRIQPRFKTITFTTNLPDEIPNVEMDVGQIQQVLMNLMNNAADAIVDQQTMQQEQDKEYQGEIGIDLSYNAKNSIARMVISDNGCGIPPETLEKVFNLHFSTKKSGHGLGLHNCKKIIHLHDGEMDVTSKPGEGTSFSITLPKVQPQKTSKPDTL